MGAQLLYAMVFSLWLNGDEVAPYSVWIDPQLMTYKQCDEVTDLLLPDMVKAAKKKWPKLKVEVRAGCTPVGVEL